VRPCAHGAVAGTYALTMREWELRLAELGRAAEARRGCASCLARYTCSRCLYPTPLDEQTYCDLIRARAGQLPLLHRLLDIVAALGPRSDGPLRLERWPRARPPRADDRQSEPLRELAEAWNSAQTWILQLGERRLLSRAGDRAPLPIDALTAELGGRIADGADFDALERLRQERQLTADAVEAALIQLAELFTAAA
jgi:hypothetical protein